MQFPCLRSKFSGLWTKKQTKSLIEIEMIKVIRFISWWGFGFVIITLSDSGDAAETLMGFGDCGFLEMVLQRELKINGFGWKRLTLGPSRLNLEHETGWTRVVEIVFLLRGI